MSATYFITSAETAVYLQQLMYEADLEAYKKSKRKKKKHGKYLDLYRNILG